MRWPYSQRVYFGLALGICGMHAAAFAADPPMTALALAPDRSELLAGSQAGVQCYSWPVLKAGLTLKTDMEHVHEIAFSPGGMSLMIAGGIPGESGSLEIWSWPEREKQAAYKLHADVIYQVAFGADAKRLFTASHDGNVFEVDLKSGATVTQFSGHSGPVRTVCLLNDDKNLVTAGEDQTLRVWETKSGKLLRSLHNHTKAIHAIAKKPNANGQAVVASLGADGTVRLWQPAIGRMMRFRRLPSAIPLALAWSSDGERLIVADDNGTLHVFHSETLETRATYRTITTRPLNVLLGPDGETAIVGGNGSLIETVPLRDE